jgi:hypothetical protein
MNIIEIDIIRMAREAGFLIDGDSWIHVGAVLVDGRKSIDKHLERFAELVAAHTLMNIDPSKFIGGYQEGFEAGAAKEREECAKVCETLAYTNPQKHHFAHAIRARSKA